MKELTVQDLKRMRDNKEDFQLIDVREEHEFETCNINGELIPMGAIPQNIEKISRNKPVIIHCHKGSRSASIVQFLELNFGYDNLYNLKGGIDAWNNEIEAGLSDQ